MVEKLTSELSKEQLESIREKSGLILSTYFSAFKIKWLVENIQEVKDACKENRCMFGTVDTWILWVINIIFYFNHYK